MADMVLNSVWDSAYYNRNEYKFVCGQKAWQAMEESQEVRFKKIARADPTATQSVAAPSSNAPAMKNREERLKELRALYDKKLISEALYNEQVRAVLSER
jgi:hypothetical protein